MSRQLESLRAALTARTYPDFDLLAWLQRAARPVLAEVQMGSRTGPLVRPEIEAVKVEEINLQDLYRVSADAYYLGGIATLCATGRVRFAPWTLPDQISTVARRTTLPEEDFSRASDTLPAAQELVRLKAEVVGQIGIESLVTVHATVKFSLVLGPGSSVSGTRIEVVDPQ